MTREQAGTLYDQGKEAVIDCLVHFAARLQALEEQAAKNSNNSSKPPSSDGLAKAPLKPMPQSLRKKSGKKPGGQKGHRGNTLEAVQTPDRIIVHCPEACSRCQHALEIGKTGITTAVSCRQVFEMPEPRIVVTEHQVLTVRCCCCGKQTQAAVPDGAQKPVQYGPHLLGFATYLHVVHLLPFARCAQIMQEVTSTALSAGSLHQALRTAHHRLAGFDHALQEALSRVPVKYVDETGSRVAGKLHWFHVRCTQSLCRLFRHERRGGEATADLQNYSGTLVSDFWSSYVSLTRCDHVFCGAHLLRELTFLHQVNGQRWAGELIGVLEAAVDACHRARERGSRKLWNARRFAVDFDRWVAEGLRSNPPPKSGPATKARRLAERLSGWRDDYLRFLFDLTLPFTNNLSEQAIRMFKVKGKVSGGFRTATGADWFCRIRSYTATCQRQGFGLLACLRSVFAGKTIMPSLQHA